VNIAVYVRLDLSAIEPTLQDEYLFTYASETVEHDAIPALRAVSITPAVIDPGRSIGQRESVSVSVAEFLHRFDAEPYNAGTFWTKFRARYESIRGLPLYVYRGERGQALADMELRQYVIDELQIDEDGATITAKDPLTLLQSSAAQAPEINTGELLAAITATDGSFTLTPTGIGDLEYEASGRLCLGGKEVASFTRVGDVVTLTTRGDNLGGVGVDHDEGTKVQAVLVYDSKTPSELFYDLLINYVPALDPSWITLSDWETEVDAYIARVYGAWITEPTGVQKLLDELCEQVGLSFYWDAIGQKLRLQPLAPPSSGTTASGQNIMQGTFSITEQLDKRVTQAWTYYGQRDATRPVDETSNYQRVVVTIADTDNDRNRSIRKVFARWIAIDARSTAERLGDMIIGRYKIPPRRFGFSLFRNNDTLPKLASAVGVEHWRLVDQNGEPVTVTAQNFSVEDTDDSVRYVAEEVNFTAPPDDGERIIFIDGDRYNINLRDAYDNIYSDVGDSITFIVEPDARVGSLDTSLPAIDVGDWPDGTTLLLINNGRIQGKGGRGAWELGELPVHAFAPFATTPGEDGGTALYTREAITVENYGLIYGGGGGGGLARHLYVYGIAPPGVPKFTWRYWAGGGGSGFDPGAGWADVPQSGPNQITIGSPPGTADAGGVPGSPGGAGGDPGQAGTAGATVHGDTGPGTAGGAAGNAVDGDSFVTFTTLGTVAGPRIN